MIESMAGRLAVLVGGYLIAAIPFGYLLYRLRAGGDIRAQGSGNIGATNVFRAAGRAAGIATFALDCGKGAACVGLTRWLVSEPAWEAAAAFVAVIGHCYPIYLRWKGGKGIATGCGAYGLLSPPAMAAALAVFAVAVLSTRMVSAGSILAGVALPLALAWLRPDEQALLISAGAAALLTIARHRRNIVRILSGEEHRVGGA